MPNWTSTGDITNNNRTFERGTSSYRPIASTSYPIGTVLQLVPLDKQIYFDYKTVQPVPAGTTAQSMVGVVADTWPGFNGSIGTPSFVSGSNLTLVRGSQFVEAVVKGIAGVLVDNSGASAVTLTNGIPLVSSRNSNGYAQGVTAGTGGVLWTIGIAVLPSTGIGSSITAAALVQASQTFTVATPAAGDIMNVVIQSPYVDSAPGVVQTATYSLALTSATAASATTAAAALVAYLNAQPSFSQYYIATNAASVVTVTANALSNPFHVNYGSGSLLTGSFDIGISGMVTNSLTTTSSVTGSGGTTLTAGGGTFGSGTGYKGLIPAMIQGEF